MLRLKGQCCCCWLLMFRVMVSGVDGKDVGVEGEGTCMLLRTSADDLLGVIGYGCHGI